MAKETMTETAAPSGGEGVASGKRTITVPDEGLEFVTPEGRVLAWLMPRAGEEVAFGIGDPKAGTGGVHMHVSPSDAYLFITRPDGGAVSLAAGDNGGHISLDNAQGHRVASIRAGDQGGEFIAFSPSGVITTRMGNAENGGAIHVRTPEGLPCGGLTAFPGGGFVHVSTPEGKHVAVMGVDQGDGTLVIFERSGAKIFAVPTWKFVSSQRPEEPLSASGRGFGEAQWLICREVNLFDEK